MQLKYTRSFLFLSKVDRRKMIKGPDFLHHTDFFINRYYNVSALPLFVHV